MATEITRQWINKLDNYDGQVKLPASDLRKVLKSSIDSIEEFEGLIDREDWTTLFGAYDIIVAALYHSAKVSKKDNQICYAFGVLMNKLVSSGLSNQDIENKWIEYQDTMGDDDGNDSSFRMETVEDGWDYDEEPLDNTSHHYNFAPDDEDDLPF